MAVERLNDGHHRAHGDHGVRCTPTAEEGREAGLGGEGMIAGGNAVRAAHASAVGGVYAHGTHFAFAWSHSRTCSPWTSGFTDFQTFAIVPSGPTIKVERIIPSYSRP